MTLAEAIETTHIHRVAGLTGDGTALVTTRPFHVPHHTISDAGLIGGCLVKNVSRLSSLQACSLVPVYDQAGKIFYIQRRGPARLAGGVMRVHHDVRFLEAFPECRRHVLGVVDRQG
jgi:hypothetical protein